MRVRASVPFLLVEFADAESVPFVVPFVVEPEVGLRRSPQVAVSSRMEVTQPAAVVALTRSVQTSAQVHREEGSAVPSLALQEVPVLSAPSRGK